MYGIVCIRYSSVYLRTYRVLSLSREPLSYRSASMWLIYFEQSWVADPYPLNAFVARGKDSGYVRGHASIAACL